MSYFVGMSPSELQFIRVYVASLRRNYYALRSVVDLMDPDGLGVKNFHEATTVALQLQEMHVDFESAISTLQKKHKMRTGRTKPHPTEDDIADLFGLSFFKLVTTSGENTPVALNQNGWFSGKPDEWQSTLKAAKKMPHDAAVNLPEILSQCFNAFAKFFHLYNTFPQGLPPNYGKKVWPKDDMYDEYDEGIDTPENPFDWFLDNDNDNDED